MEFEEGGARETGRNMEMLLKRQIKRDGGEIDKRKGWKSAPRIYISQNWYAWIPGEHNNRRFYKMDELDFTGQKSCSYSRTTPRHRVLLDKVRIYSSRSSK
ncbi:hypothetical protein RUM43_009243 [Polyplax serrata]|uniref:Uncharacterized protein n=1 Tax=Polyplax serrata TaxID=468196 RepID=A0AAN8NZE5_POLSC